MPPIKTWIQLKDLPGYTRKFKRWIIAQQEAHPTLELIKKDSYFWLVNQQELAKLNDQFLAAEKQKSQIDHQEDKLDNLENLLRVTHHGLKLRIAAQQTEIDQLKSTVADLEEIVQSLQGSSTNRRPTFGLRCRGKHA
jgi:hypothetical protein